MFTWHRRWPLLVGALLALGRAAAGAQHAGPASHLLGSSAGRGANGIILRLEVGPGPAECEALGRVVPPGAGRSQAGEELTPHPHAWWSSASPHSMPQPGRCTETNAPHWRSQHVFNRTGQIVAELIRRTPRELMQRVGSDVRPVLRMLNPGFCWCAPGGSDECLAPADRPSPARLCKVDGRVTVVAAVRFTSHREALDRPAAASDFEQILENWRSRVKDYTDEQTEVLLVQAGTSDFDSEETLIDQWTRQAGCPRQPRLETELRGLELQRAQINTRIATVTRQLALGCDGRTQPALEREGRTASGTSPITYSLAMCAVGLAIFRFQVLDVVLESLVSPAAHLLERQPWHEQFIAAVVWWLALIVLPVNSTYHILRRDWATAPVPLAFWVAVLLTSPSYKTYMLLLRLACLVFLPCRSALGALGYLDQLDFIPACVGCPVFAAAICITASEYLTVTLFFNAVVLPWSNYGPGGNLAAITAVTATFAGAIVMVGKCSWLGKWADPADQAAGGQPPPQISSGINTALALASVPVAALALLLHECQRPGELWRLLQEHEANARLVLGVVCILGSIFCLIRCSANQKIDQAGAKLGQVHQGSAMSDHQHMSTVALWWTGFLYLPVNIIYRIQRGDWTTVPVPLAFWVVLLVTSPSYKTYILLVRLSSFILIPCGAALSALGYLGQLEFIPVYVGNPIFAAVACTTASEYLAVTLSLNAVVILCSPFLAFDLPVCGIASVLGGAILLLKSVALHAARSADLRRQTAAYHQVVYSTAHDLRTPIAALKSGCSVLRSSVSKHQLPSLSLLEQMESAVKVSLGFLDTMMLAARYLDKGDVKVLCEDIVSLAELTSEAVACTSHAATPSTVMSSKVDDSLLQTDRIIINRSVVLRSLVNLLSNACRHTPAGNIDLTVNLNRHRFVVCSVTDTGEGVPPGQQGKIWEPFVSNAQSSGLGLFVVRAQCESIGGQCGMYDNPEGPGSVFWFSFPFIPAHANGPAAPHDNPRKAELEVAREAEAAPEQNSRWLVRPRQHKSGRVLIIDDTLSVLKLTAMFLRNQGFEVDEGCGPEKGAAHFPTCSF